MSLPSNFSQNEYRPSAAGHDYAQEKSGPPEMVPPEFPPYTLGGGIEDDSTIEPTGPASEIEQAGTSKVEDFPVYQPTVVAEVTEKSDGMGRRAALLMFAGLALGGTGTVVKAIYDRGEPATPDTGSGLPDGYEAPTDRTPERKRRPVSAEYPKHPNIKTTVFGIGEGPRSTNGHQAGVELAWESGIDDESGLPVAIANFGGVDDPYKRKPNGLPVGFKPNYNPFYVGIPVDEFDESGVIVQARVASPWTDEIDVYDDSVSLFKGRWVKIERGREVVYAQWVDTGIIDKGETVAADADYVFGDPPAKPKEEVAFKISPTAAHYLGIDVEDGYSTISWQFVEENTVPKGLWHEFDPVSNEPDWR
jgi:hypothetical protein